MRKFLAIVIGLALAAAFPVLAQPSADAAPCPELQASAVSDCCGTSPAAAECPVTDCAGAGAALPVASPDRGHVSLVSNSPATRDARLIARPAQAPDTAPPKPVA